MDEHEEEGTSPRRTRAGAAIAVPAVLVVVVALLLVGMLRPEKEPPKPTPIPVVPAANAFLYCSDCHADLDKVFKDGKYPNLLFTHDQHFTIGVSDCAACHVANTHEPDKINKPTMTTCSQCHTLDKDARAPGECTLCHPQNMNPEPPTHFVANWVPEKHSDAALANPFDCASCHQQSFCNQCHGLELPHPAGWDTETHAEAFFDDPALCEGCHPREPMKERDLCDTCHHPQGPESSTWISYHPTAVEEKGAENCFQCHATDTCKTCHRQGPENFTVQDLSADEALLNGNAPSAGVTTAPTPVPGITEAPIPGVTESPVP